MKINTIYTALIAASLSSAVMADNYGMETYKISGVVDSEETISNIFLNGQSVELIISYPSKVQAMDIDSSSSFLQADIPYSVGEFTASITINNEKFDYTPQTALLNNQTMIDGYGQVFSLNPMALENASNTVEIMELKLISMNPTYPDQFQDLDLSTYIDTGDSMEHSFSLMDKYFLPFDVTITSIENLGTNTGDIFINIVDTQEPNSLEPNNHTYGVEVTQRRDNITNFTLGAHLEWPNGYITPISKKNLKKVVPGETLTIPLEVNLLPHYPDGDYELVVTVSDRAQSNIQATTRRLQSITITK